VHNPDVIDDVTQTKLDHVTSFLRRQQPEVPILIVDAKVALEAHEKWRRLMPRVKPFYAMKVSLEGEESRGLLEVLS
jgi:hypothetical protein